MWATDSHGYVITIEDEGRKHTMVLGEENLTERSSDRESL